MHWIPLEMLKPQASNLSSISISLAPRLSPRNVLIRRFIHLFVGSMRFTAISLPDEPTAIAEGYEKGSDLPEVEAGGDHPNWLSLAFGQKSVPGLRLWGLTLGMTLDLISLLNLPTPSPTSSAVTSSSALSTEPSPLSASPIPSPLPSPSASSDRPPPVMVSSSFAEDSFPGGYPRPTDAAGMKSGMGRRASLGGMSRSGRKVSSSSSKRTATTQGEDPSSLKLPGRSLNAGTVSVLPTFTFADVNFFVWCV